MNTRLGVNNKVTKTSELQNSKLCPKPTMMWVIIDEHPDGINDAAFYMNNKLEWTDYPASYHNNAGGLSFADGHSEIHKWRDDATLHPIRQGNGLKQMSVPGSMDAQWMLDHTYPP
jgi:prepilin-type processing-associated H-X9-DG protein